jgi:predicted nucleic acid-binding protein
LPGLVLDASVALAAVLPEEHSVAATKVMARVAAEGALVPAIWHLEVGGTLLRAERRGAISRERRNRILKDLSAFPIIVERHSAGQAWGDILALAERHRLSLYDASYLELGIRHCLPLATFDASLRRVADSSLPGLP